MGGFLKQFSDFVTAKGVSTASQRLTRARGACPFLTDRTTTSLLKDGDRVAFNLVANERKPGRMRANNVMVTERAA